jgi:hypothetical protein
VLAGLGGVGKTSLARAYAQRHSYQLVWWIRAEDPAAVDAEFRSLLDVLLLPGDSVKVGDARAVVFAWLTQQNTPWLLILDNVPDAASVNGLLPPGNGHVLVTSRATGWLDHSVVEPLGTKAAVELLVSQSGDSDRAAAEELATELGGLPLALTQAASYTRTTGVDLAAYLRWYRDKSAVLHQEGKPADYPDTVATTWELAMDRLSPNAKTLLNLIAFYAPEAIPLHLLLKSARMAELKPLADEFTRHQAVGELCAYSLISARSDTVTVHRLVQSVTRNRLHEGDWANTARELLHLAEPDGPATSAEIATWNALHNHIHAVLGYLPPEHPETLITRRMLARGIGETGNAAQARALFAELLPTVERILGPEHSDTLVTRHNLAHWTGQAGDPARARDMVAELLPTMERIFGPDNLSTLAARYKLAHWTGQAGDPARARDMVAEILPTMERIFGPDNPGTLATRHNLANWTCTVGDPTCACYLLVELLKRILGPDNSWILLARHSVAQWTGQAGDPTRARNLFAELLPTEERILGPEHLSTLAARHNLAHWIGQSGDPACARDLFAELLPTVERILGPEHRSTLHTRGDLARWTGKAGEPGRAWELLAELLPVCERVLGTEDAETVRARRGFEYWGALVEGEGEGGGGEGEGGAGGVL